MSICDKVLCSQKRVKSIKTRYVGSNKCFQMNHYFVIVGTIISSLRTLAMLIKYQIKP